MRTIYVKYSRERDEKYQIKTSIKKHDDSNIRVYKRALNKSGEAHIQRMLTVYKQLSSVNTSDTLSYVMPKQENDLEVSFDFINGDRFSDIIIKSIKNKDYSVTVKLLNDFYKEVLKANSLIEPSFTSGFLNMFHISDASLLKKPFFSLANLDMILDNVMILDNHYIVIDYEWVYDIPVPIGFIGYRILKSIPFFDSIPKEIQNELYDNFNIEQTSIHIYDVMNQSFQNYVSGNSVRLQELYNEMEPLVVNVKLIEEKPTLYTRKLVSLVKNNETVLFKEKVLPVSNKIQYQNNDEKKQVMFQPINDNCIIKLTCFSKSKDSIDPDFELASNASYQKGDLYYFAKSSPEFYFELEPLEHINIDYQILAYHSDLISSLSELLNSENDILNKYDNLYRQYQHDINSKNNEILKLGDSMNVVAKKLIEKEDELQSHVSMLNEVRKELLSKHDECMRLLSEYESLKLHYDKVIENLNIIYSTGPLKLNHVVKKLKANNTEGEQ